MKQLFGNIDSSDDYSQYHLFKPSIVIITYFLTGDFEFGLDKATMCVCLKKCCCFFLTFWLWKPSCREQPLSKFISHFFNRSNHVSKEKRELLSFIKDIFYHPEDIIWNFTKIVSNNKKHFSKTYTKIITRKTYKLSLMKIPRNKQ